MANKRFDPVSYRPFRTQPVLAEGLLAVPHQDGGLLERASAGLFRLADETAQVAARQAQRAGALAGEQAALAGRPAATVSGGRTAGEGGGQPLTGTRAEKAARAKGYFMAKHGLSDVAASGLVGQFAQESNFNTQARNPGDGNDGSDSIGLAQWNGKRAAALRRFAAARGKPMDDFETQLDFVVHELGSSEKAVGNRLRAARTVEEATAAAIGYERPQGWTPDNPRGGHGWANRLAAARSVAGIVGPAGSGPVAVSAAAGAPVDAPAAPQVSVTGGTFRPSGRDTVRGRAYDEAGTRTYLQLVDTEMRSTTSQLFDLHRDDPAALERAYGDLKGALKTDHVFPEIEGDFEVAFGNMANAYLDQSRENLARKVEQQDRAGFIERTGILETDQQKRLADFDPGSDLAADSIAASQQAIDDHYDAAVSKGVLDADDAAKAKLTSRREAALGFYAKQAEAADADGVKSMREEMRKDFADNGIEGLDGDGWATLDAGLEKLEKTKRVEAETRTEAFRQRGDAMAARLAAGFEIDQAALSTLMLDSGSTPQGKASLEETFAKISAGRAIRDMSVRQGEAHVAGLKKQYGNAATDAQLRTLLFAQGMLEKKKQAIATDSVSYAEQQGIVPPTPMLTEAETPDAMALTMAARTKAADIAARELQTRPRYLKAGEAKAVADALRKDPASGAAIAGAIVAGAGQSAGQVLAEFGEDAPMISESGAIIAFGGSARAAEDVILGYGKSQDGKAQTGLKPDAARESFTTVTGDALALAGRDAQRIDRAAASIARKRITEQGLDPASDEALAIHATAVQEAAGAVFDRGVQFGGFADVDRPGLFAGSARVLVPSAIRADSFGDVLAAITDADLVALSVKPKAAPGFFPAVQGATARAAKSLAATLRDAVPVAVDGGFAFALGDPAGDDPQFIQGDDGRAFVLDLMAMKDRLSPRVPGAWR